AAHREVADALTARSHRALEPLAPARVKEPLRREPVAVGPDSNRRGDHARELPPDAPDLRRRQRVRAPARIDARLIEPRGRAPGPPPPPRTTGRAAPP